MKYWRKINLDIKALKLGLLLLIFWRIDDIAIITKHLLNSKSFNCLLVPVLRPFMI